MYDPIDGNQCNIITQQILFFVTEVTWNNGG